MNQESMDQKLLNFFSSHQTRCTKKENLPYTIKELENDFNFKQLEKQIYQKQQSLDNELKSNLKDLNDIKTNQDEDHDDHERCPRSQYEMSNDEEISSFVSTEIEKILTERTSDDLIDEPFYVVNLKTIIEQYYLMQTLLPYVKIYYAVKCNSSPYLIKILSLLGSNFETSSKYEIKLVKDILSKFRPKSSTSPPTSPLASPSLPSHSTPSSVSTPTKSKKANHIIQQQQQQNQNKIKIQTKNLKIFQKKTISCSPAPEKDEERIIYSNPIKIVSHLKYAKKHKVSLNSVDNFAELQKIEKYFPTAKIMIRIKVDNSFSTVDLSSKFGCSLNDESENGYKHLIKYANEHNLNVVGICYHVGSDCRDPRAYSNAIALGRKAFDLAHEISNGKFKFSILNLGGGFPGGDSNHIFVEIAKEINIKIKQLFSKELKDPNFEIFVEPGRFMCSKSHTQVSQITSIKKNLSTSSQKDKIFGHLFLNDGIYGSHNSVLLGEHLKMPTIFSNNEQKMIKPKEMLKRSKENNGDKLGKYKVWGCTCDSYDQIFNDLELPRSIQTGDYLIFPNYGDYTISTLCNFNGFEINDFYFIYG